MVLCAAWPSHHSGCRNEGSVFGQTGHRGLLDRKGRRLYSTQVLWVTVLQGHLHLVLTAHALCQNTDPDATQEHLGFSSTSGPQFSSFPSTNQSQSKTKPRPRTCSSASASAADKTQTQPNRVTSIPWPASLPPPLIYSAASLFLLDRLQSPSEWGREAWKLPVVLVWVRLQAAAVTHWSPP